MTAVSLATLYRSRIARALEQRVCGTETDADEGLIKPRNMKMLVEILLGKENDK